MSRFNKRPWGSEFPELLKIWDKDRNGGLDPLVCSAHTKAWWLCEKGHSFSERVQKMIRYPKVGCKICNKITKRLSEDYNFGRNHPEALSLWDFEKNKEVNPFQMLPSSSMNVWWKCEKGHSYLQPVFLKALRNSKCPLCSNHRPSPENNLSLHPISKEFHTQRNTPQTPQDFTMHSGKKVWRFCPEGHEFYSSINSRTTKMGSGCPHCSRRRRSRIEMWLYVELKKRYPSALKNSRIEGQEVDILLPDLKIALEVDGAYWHKREERETLRKTRCYKISGYL